MIANHYSILSGLQIPTKWEYSIYGKKSGCNCTNGANINCLSGFGGHASFKGTSPSTYTLDFGQKVNAPGSNITVIIVVK